MKKLFVIFAALLIAAPALAVDWNFYGSARVATFWVDQDLGDDTLANGDDDDADLQWDFVGNSRLGAKVKADAVGGQIELGLKGNSLGDVDVGTRRIYGTWNFGPGTLKVGKDYTPISQFISGQVFDGDLGLLGAGTAYGNRTGQLALSFGGFTLALITPNSSAKGAANGDVDEMFPKVEAKFGMGFDMFNFAVMGGYQTYDVDGGPAGDFSVDSWIVGGDVGVNFGPAYLKGAVSYGQNVGDAAWNIPGGYTTQGGLAVFDAAQYDVDDTNTLMFAVVGGFKFTDMISAEAGFGWREDDPDVNGLQEDDVWMAYGQLVMGLAPGVWVIPEFGYYDYGQGPTKGPNDDEGSQWYLGAKWQIDF